MCEHGARARVVATATEGAAKAGPAAAAAFGGGGDGGGGDGGADPAAPQTLRGRRPLPLLHPQCGPVRRPSAAVARHAAPSSSFPRGLCAPVRPCGAATACEVVEQLDGRRRARPRPTPRRRTARSWRFRRWLMRRRRTSTGGGSPADWPPRGDAGAPSPTRRRGRVVRCSRSSSPPDCARSAVGDSKFSPTLRNAWEWKKAKTGPDLVNGLERERARCARGTRRAARRPRATCGWHALRAGRARPPGEGRADGRVRHGGDPPRGQRRGACCASALLRCAARGPERALDAESVAAGRSLLRGLRPRRREYLYAGDLRHLPLRAGGRRRLLPHYPATTARAVLLNVPPLMRASST